MVAVPLQTSGLLSSSGTDVLPFDGEVETHIFSLCLRVWLLYKMLTLAMATCQGVTCVFVCVFQSDAVACELIYFSFLLSIVSS